MKISSLPIELENLWMKELSMLNGFMTLRLEKVLEQHDNGLMENKTSIEILEIQTTIEKFSERILIAISNIQGGYHGEESNQKSGQENFEEVTSAQKAHKENSNQEGRIEIEEGRGPRGRHQQGFEEESGQEGSDEEKSRKEKWSKKVEEACEKNEVFKLFTQGCPGSVTQPKAKEE